MKIKRRKERASTQNLTLRSMKFSLGGEEGNLRGSELMGLHSFMIDLALTSPGAPLSLSLSLIILIKRWWESSKEKLNSQTGATFPS